MPQPTDFAPLIHQGATACARAVAAGEATALELCDAAIAAIEAKDGALNAVVLRDFDRARDQARAADARRAKGERPALLGVPMTVKESFNIAGLPTSWGLPPFRDFRPATDAAAVQRLKAAGAVILGKTNVPAALADWQTANPIHGRTVHPLDASRTPGGSSGGGAAALAAGLVALELGSDLMGSLRVPAHFCGVWAHKPSTGILPMRGQAFPGTPDTLGPPPDLPTVIGPIARTADDLLLALDVLAGPEMPMAQAWQLQLPPPRQPDPARWQVLVLDAHPLAPSDTEVRGAVAEAARRLQAQGARIMGAADLPPGALPDLAVLHRAYQQWVMTVLGAFEPGAECDLNAHEWIRLVADRGRLRAQCFALLERVDAIVMPAFGCAAFAHQDDPDWGRRTLRIDGEDTPYEAQSAWASLASLASLPATAVPVMAGAGGLPLGVQVIGPWLHDRGTIAVARRIAGAGPRA
ncbi:amidase family protein [uncultured Pseudacidovorax sp.]|uniref:amidase family protein n=1 Tax=uncultured Pseudacidovorax sp. TaxID=679313 RepID=UPI0026004FE5|nr:amidase family protein [uncultured Pseudacidovorax sp.]